jgi:hypothetical protein
MANPVIIDIPGIGNIEAKNAATEATLRELVNGIKNLNKTSADGFTKLSQIMSKKTPGQNQDQTQQNKQTKAVVDSTKASKKSTQAQNEQTDATNKNRISQRCWTNEGGNVAKRQQELLAPGQGRHARMQQ